MEVVVVLAQQERVEWHSLGVVLLRPGTLRSNKKKRVRSRQEEGLRTLKSE